MSYDTERAYFEPNAAFVAPTISGTEYYLPVTQVLFSLSDGTLAERIRVERDANGRLKLRVDDGSVEQAELDLGAVTNGATFKLAISFKANAIRASLNGATAVVDTSATLPTVTALRLGCSPNGEQWGGGIENVVTFPRESSTGELEALAA